MSILSDKEIAERCEKENMIEPFVKELVRKDTNTKLLSYGLSSYGYDVRVSNEFKIFTNINNSVIDPKNFSNDNFVTKTTDCCILPPEVEGQVVLEFSNTTNLPAKIYANEGACQFLFFKADTVCETSYKDRSGKYQNQTGITLPKV